LERAVAEGLAARCRRPGAIDASSALQELLWVKVGPSTISVRSSGPARVTAVGLRSAMTCHGPLPCACESDVAFPQSPSSRRKVLSRSSGQCAFLYPTRNAIASSRVRTTAPPFNISAGSNMYSRMQRKRGGSRMRSPSRQRDAGSRLRNSLGSDRQRTLRFSADSLPRLETISY
jgi:hypothetical protein